MVKERGLLRLVWVTKNNDNSTEGLKDLNLNGSMTNKPKYYVFLSL